MNLVPLLFMVIGIGVWIYLVLLATRAIEALEQIAREMAQLNRTNQHIQVALSAARDKP